MGSVRVAIVGVGNCASSLVQGVEYYKDADPARHRPRPHARQFGDYHVSDVEFVAAFDVDDKKVGKDLVRGHQRLARTTPSRSPTCPPTGVDVQRGHTLDGLGKYYRETIDESAAEPVDVVAGAQGRQGRRARLLPAGGLRGGRQVLRPVRDRRRRRLRQRAARVHRLRPGVGGQVRGGRRADHRRRHQVARSARPSPTGSWPSCSRTAASRSTAPTSSTSAATWTSRTCSSASAWSPRRSPRPRPSPPT